MTKEYSQSTIDAADSILKAAGSSLRNYTPSNKDRILEATLQVMSESYIAGSNDAWKIAQQRHTD